MNSPDNFLWVPFVVQTLAATLLSGSIVGFVLKVFVDRRMEKQRFTRDWKEQSLSKVIGPVIMHLQRTSQAATRYQITYSEKTTSYFDARIMRDSNEAVRSILLSNGHLIPESLRPHSHELVAHYDLWLRRFDAKVALENPDANASFDIGVAEVEFPRAAVKAFQDSYVKLREELYGVKAA
jgi:23S rRNA C2498 (ribose-2'-O)-methylase RlmM